MKQLEMLYEGKAKQVFRTDDDDVILMHYKDAATAFNNIKKATIEGKGVLNNKISTIIFGYLKEAGIPTHYISTLNERDQLCRRVKIIPLEVIVRNIVAGSMAKRLGLEEGLRPSNTIYDICYKCDELGDPLINDHHAVALGVVTYDELKRIYDMTAKINEVLTGLFDRMNITLVDFKIGIDGNLYNPNEVYPTGTAANEAMNAFNELTFNTSEAYGVTELEADKKQLVDRYKQQMRETIDRNRDNICGMIILAETGSMFFTPQEVLAEIDRFPAEWQQRTELTDLRKVMEQRLRTTVGQPYVDISAPNADGEAVSLKSVIENPANKYVLVDFWASWCGPCLREIPYLQADYEKYRKKGFEIYAVSLDDERDAWVKTIADKQMKWIQVCDFKAFDSPASLDYAVESIPSNFLIRCSDGQIVAAQLRGKALGEKLEELLGK